MITEKFEGAGSVVPLLSLLGIERSTGIETVERSLNLVYRLLGYHRRIDPG
jgi:hypothetical protein